MSSIWSAWATNAATVPESGIPGDLWGACRADLFVSTTGQTPRRHGREGRRLTGAGVGESDIVSALDVLPVKNDGTHPCSLWNWRQAAAGRTSRFPYVMSVTVADGYSVVNIH